MPCCLLCAESNVLAELAVDFKYLKSTLESEFFQTPNGAKFICTELSNLFDTIGDHSRL